MNAQKFTNWTDEDFSWKHDGIEYDFPQKTSMVLPEHLANHFAKHLADRELNKRGIRTNDPIRKDLVNKCFSGEVIAAESDEALQVKILNAQAQSKKQEEVLGAKPEKDKSFSETEEAKKKLKEELDFDGLKKDETIQPQKPKARGGKKKK